MKSALLQYPYGEVFEPLEKICKKQGYSKIKIVQVIGVLHATYVLQLVVNHLVLAVKLEKVDDQITRINITSTWFKISSGNKDFQGNELRFVGIRHHDCCSSPGPFN